MNQFKLYTAKVCPFAQRTRIAVALKQLDCEQIEIDLTKDSESWFLELNPEGTVPTIVHEGKALYESAVVNEYLEERFPTPALYPADRWQVAASRILIDYCNRNFNPPFYKLLMNQDRSRDEALRGDVLNTLAYLDERLTKWNAGGTYVWKDFGMVDLTYAPFFKRMVLLKHYRGFEIPNDAKYRRVRRWIEALVSHPAVVATSLSDAEYISAYAAYARGEF